MYWLRRSNMMYYKYIDILMKAFAFDAESILDVGSANTKYIEAFHWIPKKSTLDIKNPYTSANVTAIEADFLTFTPEEKFDIVTCFQVLEHISEVERFAKKLFEVSDKVLISVPYLWPKGVEKDHVNDPVDTEKLLQWTGRVPSYSIVVPEPLRKPSKGISERLICYYGPEEEQINFKKAQENVLELSPLSGEDFLGNENKIYNSLQLQWSIEKLEKELERKTLANQEIKIKTQELNEKINQYNVEINKLKKAQQYYLKEYQKIVKSTSWRFTAPMRLAGSLVKKITR